jgi:glutamyl-Q tRNA(Asp) synthetase
MARAEHGRFMLRIEDIDQTRARPNWETQIYDDLTWLGLSWEQSVMRQSDRQSVYDTALDDLWARGLLYPCHCTRADNAAATSAPQEGAAQLGPDGVIYPGTCRAHFKPETARPREMALRLDIAKACASLLEPFEFAELSTDETVSFTASDMINGVGDIVLARRDMGTSYHLSVVLDDAEQGITNVIRGKDLFEATQIHIFLQKLLGLPHPQYLHHRLIRDDTGKRLAKRDDARAISLYRAQGATPQDIREMVGL